MLKLCTWEHLNTVLDCKPALGTRDLSLRKSNRPDTCRVNIVNSFCHNFGKQPVNSSYRDHPKWSEPSSESESVMLKHRLGRILVGTTLRLDKPKENFGIPMGWYSLLHFSRPGKRPMSNTFGCSLSLDSLNSSPPFFLLTRRQHSAEGWTCQKL